MTGRSNQSGVVLVDKEPGLSSAGVVAAVKRQLNLAKVGHAGTLDPFASGLLVCVCGRATRLAHVAEGGFKEYEGEIQLGVTTSTDDMTGEIISERAVTAEPAAVIAAARRFEGVITQVPPAVSAIKIDGERAYARVRRGEQVAIAPRTVVVERFTLRFTVDGALHYSVRCQKGTYIRALARDLGEHLGCGGAVKSLRRTRSEPFSVAHAARVAQLTVHDILPWFALLPGTPEILLPASYGERLSRGDQRCLDQVPLPDDSDLPGGHQLLLYREQGRSAPQGVLRVDDKRLELVAHMDADGE